MKKNLLSLLLIIGLAICVNAQEKGFYYGTRLSLGESTLSGGGISNSTGKLFWQVGGASAYQINSFLGLTADFLVTGKGAKGSGENIGGITGNQKYTFNEKVNIITADVPIMAKLSFEIGSLYLKVFAGPSVDFNFFGVYNKTYDNDNYNQDNGVNNMDIKTLNTMATSLVYGAGIDVKANDGRLFFLDFRVSNSLSDVGTLNNNSMQSSYFCLSAGYLFH